MKLFSRRNQNEHHMMTPPLSPVKRRCSDSSLFTLETLESGGDCLSPCSRRSYVDGLHPWHVRFAEGDSMVQEIPSTVIEEDVASQWYKKRDLNSFYKEMKVKVEAVKMVEGINPHSWVSSLGSAYERTCQRTSNGMGRSSSSLHFKEFARIFLGSPNGKVPIELVGAEKYIVGGKLLKDKTQRRKQLFKEIQSLQQQHDAPEELIGRASRNLSQPSRVYAHYIALLADDK